MDEAIEIVKSAALRWARHLESHDEQNVKDGNPKVHALEVLSIEKAVDILNRSSDIPVFGPPSLIPPIGIQ